MSHPASSAKQAARAASEAAMLAAATRMLLESPTTDVLASLKPVEVARRSTPARTTGAFYNIWPTQADFRRALLNHLVSIDRFRFDRRHTEALDALLGEPDADMHEILRVMANAISSELRQDPVIRLHQALRLQARADPEVRSAMGVLYSSFTESFAPRIAVILERSGRRLRQPATPEAVVVAFAALVEGLHLRWLVDPGAVPGAVSLPGDPRHWSLLAHLADTLLTGLTEPLATPEGSL
jgi:hypothetical protein